MRSINKAHVRFTIKEGTINATTHDLFSATSIVPVDF